MWVNTRTTYSFPLLRSHFRRVCVLCMWLCLLDIIDPYVIDAKVLTHDFRSTGHVFYKLIKLCSTD